MSQVSITQPTADALFPIGTADTPWSFAVAGTLADGNLFSSAFEATTSTLTVELAPGTYVVTVTKNGISGSPSDAFTVVAPVTTVTLTVPDAAQKAVVTLV